MTTAAEPTSDTIPAPRAQLSADGHRATAGARTLTASSTTELDPSGATITVTGSGYDTFKGVYVAFCAVPKRNRTPSPCGGGADTTGSTGASLWVSSNPPPYGRGLAVAYGPDGSFTATLHVGAELNQKVDCRDVQCAIVTRNDHTRSTDRSQDVFVPVSFAGSRLPTGSSGASSGGMGGALPLVIAVVAVAALAVIGGVVFRRRTRACAAGRADGPSTVTPASGPPLPS